uniref:MalT-like TPR region domain-containing protein n=1 Tax=Zooxanthella nutricula TaxID=1333877 RepID=A0A7S2VSU8_9DINO
MSRYMHKAKHLFGHGKASADEADAPQPSVDSPQSSSPQGRGQALSADSPHESSPGDASSPECRLKPGQTLSSASTTTGSASSLRTLGTFSSHSRQSTGIGSLGLRRRQGKVLRLAPSVHFLSTEFLEEVERAGLSRDSTIHEIEPTVIRGRGADAACPRDGRLGAAYVDTLEGPDSVGTASFMLSYTWGYKVGEIVDSLVAYCARRGLDPKRTYVWLCCVCINQHRVQEAHLRGETVSFEEFAEEFSSRVRSIGHVLALMGEWRSPMYITRAWCIYELYMATVLGCKLDILMPPAASDDLVRTMREDGRDMDALWQALEKVDVLKAEASVASDKENILCHVEQNVGSSRLNQRVREKLQLWYVDSALEHMEAIQQEAATSVSCEALGRAAVQFAFLLFELGHMDRAKGLLQTWIERMQLYKCSSYSPICAHLHGLLGFCQANVGETERARENMDFAIAWLERNDSVNTDIGADVFHFDSFVLSMEGDLRGAQARAAQAYRMYESVGRRSSRQGVAMLVHLNVLNVRLGELPEADRYFSEAVRFFAESRGRSPCIAMLLSTLAYACAKLGEHSRALEMVATARDMLEQTGTLEAMVGARAMTMSAFVKSEARDLAGAEADALQAVKTFTDAERHGHPVSFMSTQSRLLLAHIKAQSGDHRGSKALRKSVRRSGRLSVKDPVYFLAPAEYYEEKSRRRHLRPLSRLVAPCSA